MTHTFQYHKQWALILTAIWGASWGKKYLFSPLPLLLKIRKLPGQADYSLATVIINSYIPEQNSMELGKDQLLTNMIQDNILDPTSTFQEIPELQCHRWLCIRIDEGQPDVLIFLYFSETFQFIRTTAYYNLTYKRCSKGMCMYQRNVPK